MSDIVTRLLNKPLTAAGPITRLFRAAGVHDFPGAAHHVLRLRYGMTGVLVGAAPIERFLHEEPITVEQIGAYKNDLHRRFLRDWIARTETVRGRSLDEVWRIREECIAALGGGAHATPAG